jgi:TolB-like protein/DNA-binding winged helix-turn-helix (wHTH) protein/Tfp pilus assembly protein PilF
VAPHSGGFQIGDLSVDVGRVLVRRGAQDIALPKLSFDLLVALARAAPNLLTLDELMDQVWSGLVVAPDTVSQRVKLLRVALGDDSQAPRYIAGVRGRGYRLLPPVYELPLAAPSAVSPDVATLATPPLEAAPAPPLGPRAVRRTALFAVAVLLVITATVVLLHQRTSERTAAIQPPASATSLPERSIAVLPFVGLGKADDSDLLALGIPEAVLHQLATLNRLQVIARTSSFAFRDNSVDARTIGQRLNARYLLEGSVQSDRGRLRVTAQLIDAASGDHVWSMQLDKTTGDVFALEDEIALRVARALQISLDAGATGQLTASPTTNFDAYLEYLQAGALLSTWRLADMQAAITRAAKAVELDPGFAAAYVLLARATIRSAEFEVTADRPQRMAIALQQAQQWLQRALALDPNDSRAYVERAYLTAFHDTVAAEKDYRRALELNPNDADAYEGLATILADDPARRGAAVVAIDQARKLNPLEPRLDVIKATLIYYGRGDAEGAINLLMTTLTRDPLYEPALARLEELRWATGHPAEAVNLGEQVLSRDPHSAQARQILLLAYLDMDELRAAESVAAGNDHADASAEIGTRLYVHDLQAAANLAYAAAANNTLSSAFEVLGAAAIRIAARKNRQFARAAALFTQRGSIQWDASGRLLQGDISGLQLNAVCLGDMLMQMGETARARVVLESSLAAMDYDVRVDQRGDNWYYLMRPIALVLLGRRDEAIAVLQKRAAAKAGSSGAWYQYELEPAFVPLHNDPRFVALLAQSRAHAQSERKALQHLRAQGLVPRRG